MTASDAESLIIRPKEVYDGALPSGNSVAALNLIRLYALTHKQIYKEQAECLFNCFSSSITQAPYAYTFLLSSLALHLKGPLEITFQGDRNDPTFAQMVKTLYTHFIPFKAVKFNPDLSAGAQVHLCYRGTCRRPIESVSIFEQELLKGV